MPKTNSQTGVKRGCQCRDRSRPKDFSNWKVIGSDKGGWLHTVHCSACGKTWKSNAKILEYL
jgi:hypothetical protein